MINNLMGEKKVLVVKTSDLFPMTIRRGFIKDSNKKILNTIQEKSFYKERQIVEENEKYQQIIPQIILAVNKKIFIHKIPQSGNESRLHGLWPIFLGGHVDETDIEINNAVEREFREEIDYKGKIVTKEYIGIIKLDDNFVNKVHTGLVYIFRGVGESYAPTKDNGLTEGKFLNLNEVAKYRSKLTYWSKLFYPYLFDYL